MTNIEKWEIYDNNRVKTGKVINRGDVIEEGEYTLVVDVWIRNDKNEFLITKRTPNKSFPNMWIIPGGSASLGDDSLSAALREVKEEIGIDLEPNKGRLITSFIREELSSFKDVWLFNEDVDINDVVHQEDEVSDSMWATKEMIFRMIEEGTFIPVLSYLDRLFKEV